MSCNHHLNRRTFLKTTSAAAVRAVVTMAPVGNIAYGAARRAQRGKLTPDQIIDLMKKGNQRLGLGKEAPHDYLAQQKQSARGQYPAAVILSCIDSRAPAETIMDLGIGDTFNARVAGNISNDDILGSMEFACKLAGAKVVLVMGTPPAAPSRVPSTTRSLAISPGCSARSASLLPQLSIRVSVLPATMAS